jgi:hypothetical protein
MVKKFILGLLLMAIIAGTLCGQENSSYLSDYSIGQRIGGSILGPVLGLGHFAFMRDAKGGVTTLLLEGGGLGIFIGGAFLGNEATIYYTTFGGLGLFVVGAFYGVIRPWVVRKPSSSSKSNSMGYTSPFNIDLVSDRKGNPSFQLTYTMEF